MVLGIKPCLRAASAERETAGSVANVEVNATRSGLLYPLQQVARWVENAASTTMESVSDDVARTQAGK